MEQNVVKRLRNRIADARSLGFKIRMEPLESQSATWCEIAGIPTLFVDLSQTAGEQLHLVDQALASYQESSLRRDTEPPANERRSKGPDDRHRS